MNTKYLDLAFASSLCILIGTLIGWSVAKKSIDNACEEVIQKAYASGLQVGYSEAQQNGACLRWWTGSSTEGLQAARASFCKRR